MTVGDAVAGELGFMRSQAESLMLSSFTAQSPGKSGPDLDGIVTTAWVDEYQTVGKVQARHHAGETVEIANVAHPLIREGLHIPASSQLPAVGWRFVCTASLNPAQVGSAYYVHRVVVKDWESARRLDVVEVPA